MAHPWLKPAPLINSPSSPPPKGTVDLGYNLRRLRVTIQQRTEQQLIMLKPGSEPPRQPTLLLTPTLGDLSLILPGEAYAIDLETKGTDYLLPDTHVQMVSLANDRGCWAFNLETTDAEFKAAFWRRLESVYLIAFNVAFDGPWIARSQGKTVWQAAPQWLGCTYVLTKLLATDVPMTDISLGWFQEHILGWGGEQKEWLTTTLRSRKLAKSEMWQLAATDTRDYLYYNGQDADGCWRAWQLMQRLLEQPHLAPINTWLQVIMNEIWLNSEQHDRGMSVSEFDLTRYMEELKERIGTAQTAFLTQDAVVEYAETRRQDAVRAVKEKEPPRTVKSGAPSKRWESWNEKLGTVATGEHFNINSGPQLKNLFYQRLGYTPSRYTELGVAQLDRQLLPSLGTPGKLLARYRKLAKQEGYVAGAIRQCRNDVIHAAFIPHGTLTGRLAGTGGFNLQQQPKVENYLKLYQARPGHVIVHLDYSAVEPAVLTEASQDPTMLKVYGPDAGANDMYLLFGSNPALPFSAKIRRWYDPAAPTAEGIKLAKKHCKAERGDICKPIHLAKQYGAGVNRMYSMLVEAEVDITKGEVALISRAWDEQFKGIKAFDEKLQAERSHNGGWIINGVGRPIAIGEDKLRDIVNTYCQSTGHDLLMWQLSLIQQERVRRGVIMYPWIADYHDELMFEVPDAHIPAAKQILIDTLGAINEALPWAVTIKGEPGVAHNLAQVKLED
jgi:hypothetical protein